VTNGSPYRFLLAIGTRPEAIKMAPVLEALQAYDQVEVRVVLTGQHTTLVDQVLAAFAITPDYDLSIMKPGQTLYDVAHGCLDGLRDVVREFEPDVLLVQGDTATVFYASLVGFFEDVRVGHIEAGLRSGRKRSPFPEEVFRRLADVIADYHFPPTDQARANLLKEGVSDESIFLTGNTVVDALQTVAARPLAPKNAVLERMIAEARSFALLTAHRRESFGDPLRAIFQAATDIVARTGIEILYPVHPNPNVRGPADELLADNPHVHLIEPLGYLDLVLALRSARLVLTDSGGIQEEAPTFGTPVLVLREVTERAEGVEAGVARLVGTDRERITSEAVQILTDPDVHASMSASGNPYGDGWAARRIADVMVSALSGTPRQLEDWSGGTGEGADS